MKRQDTRAKGNGKKRMRILAVTLSVSVLFTTCPDLPETFSVLAAEEAGQPETEPRYVSAFAALPDEVKELTVPVGTALSELSLPDTLEAVVTGQPSEDTAGKPEDDGEEDSGEMAGRQAGRNRLRKTTVKRTPGKMPVRRTETDRKPIRSRCQSIMRRM